MALGENLKRIREAQGLTQYELSEKTNNIVSQGAISALEKRDSETSRFASLLAEALGVTIQELLTGSTAPDFITNEGLAIELKAKQPIAEYNVKSASVQIKKCPVISWVRAGELCDTGHIYDVDFETEWLICGTTHSDKTFVLEVVGDSMSPDYQEGCHIFVDPEVQARHNDDVIVRDEHGNATFKRLQDTPEGKYLLALNQDYPNRIIKVPEGSSICGVVIYSGKKRR